jgi:hypothetical protein
MNGENGFNTNSYISISLLVTIIGATWILSSKLSGIERTNDKLDYRMTTMEARQSRPDPWTGTDQLRWTVEFGQLNPALKVPEPKHFQQ